MLVKLFTLKHYSQHYVSNIILCQFQLLLKDMETGVVGNYLLCTEENHIIKTCNRNKLYPSPLPKVKNKLGPYI